MEKRTKVEFIVAWILIALGAIITILPIFNVTDVKSVFILIVLFYGIIHLFKNLIILKYYEYSGFSTTIACICVLVFILFFDINESPWNLALMLFLWVIMMSIIKLKECDYYHDHRNNMWLLNIINLLLFIICGILSSINLYYTGDIQVLVLGFFFLINGILELMDPLAAYVLSKKK